MKPLIYNVSIRYTIQLLIRVSRVRVPNGVPPKSPRNKPFRGDLIFYIEYNRTLFTGIWNIYVVKTVVKFTIRWVKINVECSGRDEGWQVHHAETKLPNPLRLYTEPHPQPSSCSASDMFRITGTPKGQRSSQLPQAMQSFPVAFSP